MYPRTSTQNDIPAAVVDAAIDWMVKLEFYQPSAETQAAFNTWLNERPLHVQAWERVRSLRDEFAAVPTGLASHALHAVGKRRQENRLSRRQTLKLLMLAGVAVSATWAVRNEVPWQRTLADASTRIGEQRTIALDDGSIVVLNTDSAVSFALHDDQRRIVLHRGEIMITTGADTAYQTKRPFWVDTPFGTMQALGTRFVVRLDDDRARISVQEGAVQMHPAKAGDSVIAKVGESWLLSERAVEPAGVLGMSEDGWTDGVIAGQNMRLGDLLNELSRYRRGKIACDSAVADLRVSGIYHTRDTDQVLQFLVQTQPVTVTYYTRFWVVVGRDDERSQS